MQPWRWALPAATLAVFVIQCLIQPAALYHGDPMAIRAEAEELVAHGRLGIPVTERDSIPPELIPPHAHDDQYLWWNASRGAWFSRWGITNTLAFAVPLLFHHPASTEAPLFLLNLYNAVLTALLVAGMLFACRRVRVGVAVPFVLGWVYASYLIFYARAQSAEIVQCVLIVWAFAAFREANRRRDLGPLLAMNVLFAALTLARLQFAIGWALALGCTFAGRRERRGIGISALIVMAAIAIQLGMDAVKFGSPFELGKLGYHYPHAPDGPLFSLKAYASSLPDFLWGAKGSLVRFAPLLLIAIAGAAAHARRAPREAIFAWGVLASNVLIAGAMKDHNGEWCFGPRYLVQSVAMLAPVGAEAFASIRTRAFAWVAFAALAAFGLRDEIIVGLFHPLAAHRTESILRAYPLPPGGADYLDRASRVEVFRDLRGFCEGEENPLTSIVAYQLRTVGADRMGRALSELHDYCEPNLALRIRSQ